MKHLPVAFIALAVLFGAASLHAAGPVGFYGGLSYGRAFLRSDAIADYRWSLATGATFSRQTDAWRISGGYAFTPVFALEAAYVDLGGATQTFLAIPSFVAVNTHLRITGSAFTLAPVVTWSPIQALSFSAKAGLALETVKALAFGAGNIDESDDSTEARLLLGVATAYTISEHWRCGVDLEYTDLGSHFQARNLRSLAVFATLSCRL